MEFGNRMAFARKVWGTQTGRITAEDKQLLQKLERCSGTEVMVRDCEIHRIVGGRFRFMAKCNNPRHVVRSLIAMGMNWKEAKEIM